MRIPESLRADLSLRARETMAMRKPDFTVGDSDPPYLKRWYALPRNRWAGLYVHQFLANDEDRAEHDHMYLNASVVLDVGYIEHSRGKVITRKPGDIVFRWPSTPHRLELIDGKPAISMFFMGPRVREWGFHCPNGWRHWKEFIEVVPGGNKTGRGCE